MSSLLKKLEALGHGFFYAVLFVTGQGGAYFILGPVIFTYVLFSRKIHQDTAPYRQKRFPGRKGVGCWLDTFRIVYSFGKVLVDRGWLGIKHGRQFEGELIGREELLGIVKKGKGLVLLTAHVGNWQTALAHICELPAPVNSLMHYEQEAVAKHYFDLRKEPLPFKIINNEGFLGGMVESTAALQKGEVVTIMGDRLTKGPHAEVDFLGFPARLPSAAYNLAAATGSPVAVLLAAKTGRKRYSLRVWDVFYPEKSDRDKRQDEIVLCAKRFAGAMEKYTESYPYQWYNFFDFWKQ
ncbi:MAG: lysophospholipid acyltransferase family protein [Proteobacteria bacterium]|nr:lysophospholipid acyltransferase family protein [Pseudomonadota bacterium]MBU1710681.1 lysophospholipid acyltransferase family protein [Pseudomonadota bacterium]